jgi:hypothetical protein
MSDKPTWPRTLEEAVDYLRSRLPDEDKERLRAMRREDLVKLHFGWGTGIRNSLGLWKGNSALLESCGTSDADSASWVIIHAVWRRLQEDGPGHHSS